MNCIPDDLVIDRIITVNNTITHTDDPRNVGNLLC